MWLWLYEMPGIVTLCIRGPAHGLWLRRGNWEPSAAHGDQLAHHPSGVTIGHSTLQGASGVTEEPSFPMSQDKVRVMKHFPPLMGL